MNKLDVPVPQAGPLGLSINDGTSTYEGSVADGTGRNKELVRGN